MKGKYIKKANFPKKKLTF